MKIIGNDFICQICLRVVLPDAKHHDITVVCNCTGPAIAVHNKCLKNYTGPVGTLNISCERCMIIFCNRQTSGRYFLALNTLYRQFHNFLLRFEKYLFVLAVLFISIRGNYFLIYFIEKYKINLWHFPISYFLGDLNYLLSTIDIGIPRKIALFFFLDYGLSVVYREYLKRMTIIPIICQCFINRFISIKIFLKDDLYLSFLAQIVYLKIPFYIFLIKHLDMQELYAALIVIVLISIINLLTYLQFKETGVRQQYIVPLFEQ